MHSAEEQLATIGFARLRRDPECWRSERVARSDVPKAAAGRLEPGFSLALRRWRDLLARDARPSPYRIARA